MPYSEIIDAARRAHRDHWQQTSDEGEGDRMATAVTEAWQNAVVSPPDVDAEVPVSETLRERIDLIDRTEATAYEMKVSGKNADHEFYKDIFKVWVYNRENRPRLERFVFISEASGIDRLTRGLPSVVTDESRELLGFSIELVPV